MKHKKHKYMEDKLLAFKDLSTFKKFCDEYGITFWLDDGTLLGAVRNGQFIPWEGDIDLGTTEHDIKKVYENRRYLEDLGYRFFPKQQGYGIIGKNLSSKIDISSYKFKDDIAYQFDFERNIFGSFFDLFIFVLNLYDGDYKYETIVPRKTIKKFVHIFSVIPESIRMKIIDVSNVLYDKIGKSKLIVLKTPKYHFDKLLKIKFYDEIFNSPCDIENYLKNLYGSDWRIPKIYSNDKKSENYKWKGFKNTEIT